MKYTVSLLMICLLASTAVAQSTCETRVDAHQKATTQQRIAYCLTPGSATNRAADTGLIFSGVTPRTAPQTQTASAKTTAKPGYFKEENVAVTRNFVGTNHFPQLANGPANTRVAYVQQVNVVQMQEEPVVSNEVVVSQTAQRKKPVYTSSKETAAGLRARSTKPWRRLAAKPAVVYTEEQAPQSFGQETTLPSAPSTQEVETLATDYVYDTIPPADDLSGLGSPYEPISN